MGAILTDARVTAELIADGVHVQPAALRLTVAAKGPDGVILVSDATSATGMPEGSYQLGPLRVTVREGVCRNEEGKLAGSVLTLESRPAHHGQAGVRFVSGRADAHPEPGAAPRA